jgi:hypothetical protein|tara:strand:- start:189 stop:443 length:255 start_codon:yes stop_codon:yes gene_type:complete
MSEVREGTMLVLSHKGSREFLTLPQERRLEYLQTQVGGYIEMHRLDDEHYCVVNEEGRLKGLPRNPYFPEFVGNVVIIRSDDLD